MRSDKQQAGLQKADAAEIFDAVDRQRFRGQAELGEDRGRKVALEGDVVDRDHRAGPRAVRVVQIGGRERRLPVVGVNDLRPEGGDRARARCRRRPAPAPRSAAHCRASRARRGRDRGCPAGRRDAARRARTGRAPPPRRRGRAPGRRTARRMRAPSRVGELGHHRRIAGHERAHLDAFARRAPRAARRRRRRGRRS